MYLMYGGRFFQAMEFETVRKDVSHDLLKMVRREMGTQKSSHEDDESGGNVGVLVTERKGRGRASNGGHGRRNPAGSG